MPFYEVDVTVRYRFEVEADNIKEAEEEGWKWEDYAMYGEVYALDVAEIYIDEEDDEDD